MKVGFKKTKKGFEYTGDLNDCIYYAEKRLIQLEQNLPYVTKRFLEEQKRYDTLKRSIENCKRFRDRELEFTVLSLKGAFVITVARVAGVVTVFGIFFVT